MPTTSPPSWTSRPSVEGDLLDPAADAGAGLEDEHVGAAGGQVAGGGEPGEAGAERRRRRGTWERLLERRGRGQRRTRQCSGSQPISDALAVRPAVLGAGTLSRFCSSTESSTPGAISSRYVVVGAAVDGRLDDAVGLHHVRA